MTNRSFVGNTFLYRGDGGSPQTFARVCAAFGTSGIGQTNELVESTTYCSGGVKEYVPGLSDGAEVTIEMNFETIQPESQVMRDMIADTKAKRVVDFEQRFDGNNDGVDTDAVFHFSVAMLSWTINPSVSAKQTITFTGKISGDVNVTFG